MAQRTILCVFEKCLDCWNFKRYRGAYQCEFGLVPVILTEKKEGKTKKNIHCYGYFDRADKEAPAKRKLMKKAVKFKKLKLAKEIQEK